MGKRYHIKDDVWIESQGRAGEFSVEVAGDRVADLYFFRQIIKHGVSTTSRLTYLATGERVEGFACYFKDVKKYLRWQDWNSKVAA